MADNEDIEYLDKKSFNYLIKNRLKDVCNMKGLESVIHETFMQFADSAILDKSVTELYTNLSDNKYFKNLGQKKDFICKEFPNYFYMK